MPRRSTPLRIALTFDDGPSEHTSALIDALEQEAVPAAFFMIGENARKNPELVRRVAESPGMEIGSHTLTHPSLVRVSDEQIATELTASKDLLEQLTGQPVDLFRPPMGHRNAEVDRVAGTLGQAVIKWSLCSWDFRGDPPRRVAKMVTRSAKDGDIVLLHELPNTVEALVPMIHELKKKGFSFVGVGSLLGAVDPGTVYTGTAPRSFWRRLTDKIRGVRFDRAQRTVSAGSDDLSLHPGA